MQKGDIVLVNFTGKESESKMVFDTTDEKIAKQSGIFRENHVFRPIPIVIGNGELILGLEEGLLQMKEGEEKKLEIPHQKAFGERRKELVAVVPLQQFRKQKLNPVPGMIVEINNRPARVQTISGGRVRIDFNSELAGKKVEYDIKIEKHVKEPKEQVDVFLEKFFPIKEKSPKAKISGEELEITFQQELPQGFDVLKKAFAKVITDSVKGIKKVRFTEEFAKEKDAKQEKTESQNE